MLPDGTEIVGLVWSFGWFEGLLTGICIRRSLEVTWLRRLADGPGTCFAGSFEEFERSP
jgi:hypothetical protein